MADVLHVVNGACRGGQRFLLAQALGDRVADGGQLLDLFPGEPIEQMLAHALHVGGSGTGERGEASSVRMANAPRRSVGQLSRRTQPFFSNRATACESRLRDDSEASARSLIRSERSGASDSWTRIS